MTALGADQLLNARRVEALGLGRALDPVAVTPAGIAGTVADLLAAPPPGVAALRAEYAALPPPAATVPLLAALRR